MLIIAHMPCTSPIAGAVELENLPLKKDALKSLDLPLEVKAGKLSKLHTIETLKISPFVGG